MIVIDLVNDLVYDICSQDYCDPNIVYIKEISISIYDPKFDLKEYQVLRRQAVSKFGLPDDVILIPYI